MLQEEFEWLEHPLAPTLEIQCSISIESNSVRMVWFPHPVLITQKTRVDFILLANEANIELHSGGRFWCNEDMDFAYEIVLSAEMIENPLMMLAENIWSANTAISYLKELRENGYVDNRKYNLW